MLEVHWQPLTDTCHGMQGYVDLETRGNTLMVAGSPKYAEVIEATAKRFKDRPERERRRSPSPRSAACLQ